MRLVFILIALIVFSTSSAYGAWERSPWNFNGNVAITNGTITITGVAVGTVTGISDSLALALLKTAFPDSANDWYARTLSTMRTTAFADSATEALKRAHLPMKLMIPTDADTTAQDSLWVCPYFDYSASRTVQNFLRCLSESAAATDSVRLGIEQGIPVSLAVTDSFRIRYRATAATAAFQILIIGVDNGIVYWNRSFTPAVFDEWVTFSAPVAVATIPRKVRVIYIPKVAYTQYVDLTGIEIVEGP